MSRISNRSAYVAFPDRALVRAFPSLMFRVYLRGLEASRRKFRKLFSLLLPGPHRCAPSTPSMYLSLSEVQTEKGRKVKESFKVPHSGLRSLKMSDKAERGRYKGLVWSGIIDV
jgi:hypothetical protein